MSLDCLNHPSPQVLLEDLAEQCAIFSQRKYLLNTVFFREFARLMERVFDHSSKPALLACDAHAFQGLTPPNLPFEDQLPKFNTREQREMYIKQCMEGGVLFNLIFKYTTFPPTFHLHTNWLPRPIQRLLHLAPNAQSIPAWFRARVMSARAGPMGGRGGGGAAQQLQQQQGMQLRGTRQSSVGAANAAAGRPIMDQLEVSLYEYYFLGLVHFICQNDVHVQGTPIGSVLNSPYATNISSTASPSNPLYRNASATALPVIPPTPRQYNEYFTSLLAKYLHFFVPLRGSHSSSLKLEEKGWNTENVLAHGITLVEVLAENVMGQYSYEAAQNPSNIIPSSAQTSAPSTFFSPLKSTTYPTTHWQSPNHQSSAVNSANVGMVSSIPNIASPVSPNFLPPLDETTLPSLKIVQAMQTLVYHLIEVNDFEPPKDQASTDAIVNSRTATLQYLQEKYSKYTSSMHVKARVDWHLFGVLQHCFHRWSTEWSTMLGVAPVPSVSLSGTMMNTSSLSTTSTTGSLSALQSTSDERFTKMIELWLDYLEPWQVVYGQAYTPATWKWWIILNLPFYTILLRDFLRKLAQMDLGHTKSVGRVKHLKTVLHVLMVFDDSVLESIQECETLLFKQLPSGSNRGSERNEASAQQTQEASYVRQAFLHLSNLRPENYMPVFPQAAAYLASQMSSSRSATSPPTHYRSNLSPQSRANNPSSFNSPTSPRDGQSTSFHFRSPSAHASQTSPSIRLDSQMYAQELIQQWSIGLPDGGIQSLELSIANEKKLLAARVEPVRTAASLASERSLNRILEYEPLNPSLLLQEEQLGVFIEKRLRMIFGLPDQQNSGRNRLNRDDSPFGVAPSASSPLVPRSLRDLEPEYERLADGHFRLTESGREQIRLGGRLCSKRDIPVLGDERSLPPMSYEIDFLLPYTFDLTAALNEKFGFPAKKGGFQFNMRFLAHQRFWKTLIFLFLSYVLAVFLYL